jgi:hypothetical protein
MRVDVKQQTLLNITVHYRLHVKYKYLMHCSMSNGCGEQRYKRNIDGEEQYLQFASSICTRNVNFTLLIRFACVLSNYIENINQNLTPAIK